MSERERRRAGITLTVRDKLGMRWFLLCNAMPAEPVDQTDRWTSWEDLKAGIEEIEEIDIHPEKR